MRLKRIYISSRVFFLESAEPKRLEIVVVGTTEELEKLLKVIVEQCLNGFHGKD